MTKLKGIELRGQGEDLSPNVAYEGQWILRDVLFLFEKEAPSTQGPEFTAAFKLNDGTIVMGIDAGKIGAGLNLTAAQVLAHNRARTLFLTAVHGMREVNGSPMAKMYVFAVEGAETQIVMESGPFGTA